MPYIRTFWKDRKDTTPSIYLINDKPCVIKKDNSNLLERGTSINATNLNKIETALETSYNLTEAHEEKIQRLIVEVSILKNASINGMDSNIFIETFEDLQDINLKSGVYDIVNNVITT